MQSSRSRLAEGLAAPRWAWWLLIVANTGCASTPRGPAPIASLAIASALEEPREHPDAPLGVRDTEGRPYAIAWDEVLTAPTPPDGRERPITLRALTAGCENGSPCWLRRPFLVRRATESVAKSSDASAGTAAAWVAGALIVGAIAGSYVCWERCPEPWDSAVPIGVGSLTLVGLAVGVALGASAMSAGR